MPISPSNSSPSQADPARAAQSPRPRTAPAEDPQVFFNAFGSQIATLSQLQLGLTAEGRASSGQRRPAEQTAAFADPLGLAVREELTTAGGQAGEAPARTSEPEPRTAGASTRQVDTSVPGPSQRAAAPRGVDTDMDDRARTASDERTSNQHDKRDPAPQQNSAATAAPVPVNTASATSTQSQPAAQQVTAATSTTQVDAASAAKPAAPTIGLARLEALARDRASVRAPEPKPQPPTQQQAEDAPLAAQVSRGLASVLRRGGGTTLIRLQPEALGAVRVHLNLSDANVQARVEATTAQARDLLMQGIQSLRAALEQRGLRVEQLDVVLSQTPAEQAKTGDKAWGSAERGTGQQPGDPEDSTAAEMAAEDQREHAANTDSGRTPPRVSTQGRGSADTAPEDPEPQHTEHQAEGTGIVHDADGIIRLNTVA